MGLLTHLILLEFAHMNLIFASIVSGLTCHNIDKIRSDVSKSRPGNALGLQLMLQGS